MEVLEFQKDFLEEVKVATSLSGEGSVATFVSVATSYMINSEALPDFSPAFFLGTGKSNRKIRVDGYVLDDFDNTLTLFIANYTGELDNEPLTKTEVRQQFDRLRYFIEEVYGSKLVKEIEPSTAVADLIDLMLSQKAIIRKYRLIFLCDGLVSNRATNFEVPEIEKIPVECQAWDINRIFQVCFSDIGRQNIEIDFKTYTTLGIPCIEATSANSNDYKSFLCIIPGETLASIYDLHGSQLLEGNVRSFLSTKVAVNKKIRETILQRPDKFFAYNNGVSATAMNLRFETTPMGRFIVYAKDFQIINGGQTTASLSNARHKDKADLNGILVQMKLTEVDSDSDQASELIRNISRSSNSQNKVSDADFFSTHPFHVRMEQISRRVFAPAVAGSQHETKWFYERARGQYFQAQMRMSKQEKAKFAAQHPKGQLVTKTDFAKIRNTWDGLPQTVSKGAQTNFTKFAEIVDDMWTQQEVLFNEKYFKESIALTILFKHTENIVSHQAWYEQGYRANIVTYSIALLREQLKKQFPDSELNLLQIWNKQTIPIALSDELVKITKIVFDTITDPARETINVTQWCKRDACWSKVKECSLLLNQEAMEPLMICRDDARYANKEAKSGQKVISDAEAQAVVINHGAPFWTKVNDFVLEKQIGSPDMRASLMPAMSIPRKIPNPYQSKKLLKLLEIAETEGFHAADSE